MKNTNRSILPRFMCFVLGPLAHDQHLPLLLSSELLEYQRFQRKLAALLHQETPSIVQILDDQIQGGRCYCHYPRHFHASPLSKTIELVMETSRNHQLRPNRTKCTGAINECS